MEKHEENRNHVTIGVHKDTHERLKALKDDDESYDLLLRKMANNYEFMTKKLNKT
jgi:hypothetical protein